MPRSKSRVGESGFRPLEPEQVLYHPTLPTPGQLLRLSSAEAHHARRSLRLRPGDTVFVVDGQGNRGSGTITDWGRDHLDVRVETVQSLVPWPNRRIWLGVGVIRSARMDLVVEKASELGVERISPLLLARSVARPHEGGGTKQDRWHRLALESLKQSKRARLMEVTEPLDLEVFLDDLPPDGHLWAADPAGGPATRAAAATGPGPVALVVGPEGGLTPGELEGLHRRGGHLVRLGGHRLRAETAALALTTAALVTLGEMDPPGTD